MKKLICLTIILSIIMSSFAVSYAAELPLKDIGKHWAKENIMYLYNQKLVGGYPDGTYKPDNPVNVAEFLKIVTLGMGFKLERGTTKWYENYVSKALEIGLISDGEYVNLTAPLTREQVAKIVVSAVLANEAEPSQDIDDVVACNIKDYAKISEGNKKAVINAYKLGLIAGNPDGNFNPKDTLTRAEMCTVVIRLMDKAKRMPFKPENGSAIKLTNIFSGKEYLISRPDKKEEIQFAYMMMGIKNKSKGWYDVSYYPDNISNAFYDNEEQFKNDGYSMQGSFTTYLDRNDVNSYNWTFYDPIKMNRNNREIIIEATKYLYGKDYLKAFAVIDTYLKDAETGNCVKKQETFIFNNRKMFIYRSDDIDTFVVKTFPINK